MRASFPIVGSFNRQRSDNIDSQRTINLYEFWDPEGKKPSVLLTTGGLEKVAETIGKTGARNAFVFKDFLYFVVEDTVFRMDSNLIPVVLGTLTTSMGHVGITANVNQVIFVDGVNGYIWDTTTLMFNQIINPNFPPRPGDVAYQDGFFIIISLETNEFQVSGLNDGNAWDALKKAEVESIPDDLVAITSFKRRLFLFGKRSTEVWFDAGRAAFPFTRDNNVLQEYGVAAASTVVQAFDVLMFLSRNNNGVSSILLVEGTQAIPVSTTAIEFALGEIEDEEVADATAFLYKENGNIFYQINFTKGNRTFVYNLTTKKWHEQLMLDESRHLANAHAYFANKHLMFDYASGNIYRFSEKIFDNNGEGIRRTRITGHFSEPYYNKIQVNRIRVDVRQGRASANGVDQNPLLYLNISKDGGLTYGPTSSSSTGTLGARTVRTTFKRLGISDDWVYKFEFYAKQEFMILGASISYEKLPQ